MNSDWLKAGMEEKASLRYAAKILAGARALEREIFKISKPLDQLVAEYQRAHPAMGKNDRKVLATAVYGLARHREALCAALPQARPGAGDLLALALLDRVCEADLATFPEADKFSNALECLKILRSDALLRLEAEGDKPLTSERANLLTLLFSVPPLWLSLGPWKTPLDAASELSVGRVPQKTTLRVNHARATREEALNQLRAAGVEAEPTLRSPWGITLPRRLDLRRLELWKQGLVEVQDEGSQLISQACGPFPDHAQILDHCAGAGGKTLALAASCAASGGKVTAHDADAGRLKNAVERIQRAGAQNISLATTRELEGRFFDIVLVDAPCSSTGTLRRTPEIPWRWEEEDFAKFSRLQGKVLGEASERVRPGGLLVYATCSLMPIENREVVDAFLKRRDDFEPEAFPKAEALRGLELRDSIRLRLDLANYSGDSFFVARLRKRG